MHTYFLWIFRAINYTLVSVFLEWPRGIDFSMRDKNSNIESGLNGYARTSKSALRRIYKIVDIKNKHFLDIGSGKGAVVYNTFQLGAKLSFGIEFNEKLHRIALSNFNHLHCADTCFSIHCDAREFERYSDFDIFFLFNPFDDTIYSDVMFKINEQLKGNNKVRWIIAYGKSNTSAIMKIENISMFSNGICPYRNTQYNIYKIN